MPVRTEQKSLDDFYSEVRLGNVAGTETRTFKGENPDVDDNATFETLWAVGGLYVYPSAAAQLDIVSTDANDTAAGSGAQEVTVVGLDGSYDPLTEAVAMNGTTPVQTTGSFLRVNEFRVSEAGASKSNEGTITAVSGSDTLSIIEPGESQDFVAVYTVPNGKVAIPLDMRWGVDDDGLVEAVFIVQTPTVSTRSVGIRFGATGDPYITEPPAGLAGPFPAQTDIEARARVFPKQGNQPSVVIDVGSNILVVDV